MGKNKGGRNGFYFFMLDLKNTHGRKYNSMAEVSEAAGPFWQRMSKEQKRQYEEKAKEFRQNEKKQTSIGESVDQVEQAEHEKRVRETVAKKTIETLVNGALKSGTIAEQNFYIMYINEFCYCEKEKKFYPAEIALCRFNLCDGINPNNVYTSLVKPGPLPLGYSATAKQHSEETHQIPIPYGPDVENNTDEILSCILSYLSDDTESGTYPPIFVHDNNLSLVENVLENICYELEHENHLKIYSLQYLLYTLRNAISKCGPVWPSISVSQLELQKDVYDYTKGIACEFHDTTETPIHCCKSKVIRFAYIICDNCNEDLGIECIPGQHVPLKAICLSRPHSSASVSHTRSVYATPAESVATGFTRTESRLSVVSEVNSVADTETTTYKGFDTDSQCDADEGWQYARTKLRKASSQMSSSQSQEDQLLSQSSGSSVYIPNRRPVSVSGIFLQANQRGNNRPRIGRGRGRGVANV